MYHQLTNSQTKLWLLGGNTRREIAANIAAQYSQPVAVVAWRGQVIADVAPDGRVKERVPPFQKVFRRDVANAPSPAKCACREYFDPEVGGPWKNRSVDRHHPHCEFSKTSHEAFDRYQKAVEEAGGTRNLRPDTILRIEEEVQGKRGAKTGARKG